ncbi:MAG: MFS transporter [Streptosporangiales bacterium]|nr:MFS transporter [Streptosporangiales bacterium]
MLASDFAILALSHADRAVMGVAAPLIIADLGFGRPTFGWILAAVAFTSSPFAFLGGLLADKVGPRKVMGWATLVWSVFTALTAAGIGFVTLLLIRLFFGAGEGPQTTATAKILHNWFPKHELGTAVGIANAATPLGGVIATPLVVAILSATHNNWRVAFVIFGALGVLFTIGWFVVVRDRPGNHPRVSPAELEHIHADTAPAAEVRGRRREGDHRWWRFLAVPAVWATAVAFFGYAWILWTFVNWFPMYLVQERDVDITGLAVSGAIPWVGGCVGLVLGGLFTDAVARRTGASYASRRWTVVAGLLLTGLLFALIGVVDGAAGAVALMSAVVFLLYFTGAQYWLIVGEAVPGASYGAVSGAVQMVATTAAIIAPATTGYLVESAVGWGGTFAIASGIAVVGSVLLAAFGRLPIQPAGDASAR